MSVREEFRRTAAIAGMVTDALSGAAIAGALVEIVEGPPAFEKLRDLLAASPGGAGQAERLDRRLSRSDGSYFFANLPAGGYQLRVSAPGLGSRYGKLALDALQVAAERAPGGRVQVAYANAALPPTCIRGKVTSQATNSAIAGAKVRLRGDTRTALTADDGTYLLSGLVKGSPTVEISAKSFITATRATSLSAGQEQTVDVALTPAPPAAPP